MLKKFLALLLSVLLLSSLALVGCDNSPAQSDGSETSSSSQSGDKSPTWDGNSITYSAADIARFGSGTPYGYANYDNKDDVAVIWNTDVSLDNYGGVQTPMLYLDFSKAVTFKMNVVDCYSQYIVKLAVEGESEYYYVLSDDDKTGEISVNVVDSMLCEKYRKKNTQPDPGYQSGWKYDGQKKNCSFHILAKGPDGEQQTAELKVKSVGVFNNETAVTGVKISGQGVVSGAVSAKKGSDGIDLSAAVSPSSITDKSVYWSSLDDGVARIDENGGLEFVGVGKTYVTATSKTDQSKSDQIEVNVTSGYENTETLKAALSSLKADGSEDESEIFEDIFKTTWAQESAMTQTVFFSSSSSVNMRSSGINNYMFDHFAPTDALAVSQANLNAEGDSSYLSIAMTGASGATVYRMSGGKLVRENYNGQIKIKHLEKKDGVWSRIDSCDTYFVIVLPDGSVKKALVRLISCEQLVNFSSADFADPSLWTIPDRTKQTTDSVAHALSPASVTIEGEKAVLKQNKYPEAKYCFGGIVGNILDAREGRSVEIVIDVSDLNRMNEFVKTMWEIKILYYEKISDKYIAVSANPIKLAYSNEAGVSDFTFRPAYRYFRLYLVVNGSDIGAQFADAEMKIKTMQIYSLD